MVTPFVDDDQGLAPDVRPREVAPPVAPGLLQVLPVGLEALAIVRRRPLGGRPITGAEGRAAPGPLAATETFLAVVGATALVPRLARRLLGRQVNTVGPVLAVVIHPRASVRGRG